MNQKWLLIIFLLIGHTAGAQSHKVYGKVTNTRLEPVAFASVQVKGSTLGTLTNENEDYSILLDDGE